MGLHSSATFVLGAFALGCGPAGGLANHLAKPPDAELEGQTRCKVNKSQQRPLIVEWPTADRAQLEAEAQGNTVVVAYDGCEMRLLPHCNAPGEYLYRGVTPKEDTVAIRNEDDLYSTIPVYAARFEGKLATAGQLNIAITQVGRMETNRPQVSHGELSGMCDGATHIVAGLAVGAFEFYAGAAANVGAGAEFLWANAGGRSRARRETLTKDGVPDACLQEGDFGAQPPDGCGALLRVEVVRLRNGIANAPPLATASPQVAPPSLPVSAPQMPGGFGPSYPVPVPVTDPLPTVADSVLDRAEELADEPSATPDLLVTAGLVTASVGYGLAIIGSSAGLIAGGASEGNGEGSCSDSMGYGFIPLAGPILTSARWPNYTKYYDSGCAARCSDYSSPVAVFAAVDATMQIGGLATALVGMLWPRQETAHGASPIRVGALPTIGEGHAGISVYVEGF